MSLGALDFGQFCPFQLQTGHGPLGFSYEVDMFDRFATKGNGPIRIVSPSGVEILNLLGNLSITIEASSN